MNSLRSLGRAIDYEVERQIGLLDGGERVVQETRHWNEEAGRTDGMRSKEEAFDYRYFPEPDLVPVRPTDEMRAVARESVPELPAAQARSARRPSGESRRTDARCSSACRGLRRVRRGSGRRARGGAAKDVVNWCTGDLLGYLNETGLAPSVLRSRPTVSPSWSHWSRTARCPRSLAKDVLGRMPGGAEAAEAGGRRAWARAGERRG